MKLVSGIWRRMFTMLVVLIVLGSVALAGIPVATTSAAGPAAVQGVYAAGVNPQAVDSVVRTLCSNAHLYSYPVSGSYLRTVHAGRGFRVYQYQYDEYGRLWAYGHSAEAPNTNGFILEYHLC